MFDGKPRTIYVAAEDADKFAIVHRSNARKIQSVMFLVAVARPRDLNHGEGHFSGRVLLLPMVKPIKQKKRSVRRSKNANRYEPIKVTKAVFFNALRLYVIPAVKKIVRKDNTIKKVVIQMDNAAAHGGGRANMQLTLDEINQWRECAYRYQSKKPGTLSRVRTSLSQCSLAPQSSLLRLFTFNLFANHLALLTSMHVTWAH